MSLVVWLPLTKDLRNQGLSDVTVTNNGATFNSAGKLGGCYNFTNQNIVIPSANFKSEFTNNQASLAAWVKVSTSHNTYAQALVLGTQGTSWNNILFGIDINTSGTPIANTSTGSAYTNLSFGTVIKDGVWHHIVYTYNAGTMTVYLDGVQKATKTTSNTPAWTSSTNLYIGGNTAGEKFQNGDGMNDVRVYNHCLSPMEVKELAKGLVLHYPLNRQGWGQENLLLTTPRKATTTEYQAYQINMSKNLEEGKTYTIQMWDVNVSHTGKTAENLGVSFWWGGGNILIDKWHGTNYFINGHADYLSKTFTITSTQASGTGAANSYLCIYNSYSNASGTKSLTIGKWKLEESSIATPWSPAPSDTLADTMGLNSNIEYDTSGFNNNGTRTGTFSWTSDTPKYEVSTKFNGAERIEADSLPSETQTIACWVNFSEVPSNNYTIPIFDKNSGLAIGVSANARLITYIGTTAGGTGTQVNTSFDTNKWYHIVAVKTGDNTRNVYINGELKPSGGGNWWSGDLDKLLIGCRHISSGYSSPFKGQLCDVRAYATALSADDVKSLYQNCATIGANGKIYGQIRA